MVDPEGEVSMACWIVAKSWGTLTVPEAALPEKASRVVEKTRKTRMQEAATLRTFRSLLYVDAYEYLSVVDESSISPLSRRYCEN